MAKLDVPAVSIAAARNVPVEMRDGTVLRADIYRTSAADSQPVLLIRNPYYRWIGPEDAGAVVVRAIKRGDLYALTHPEWYAMVAPRHEAIAAAFRAAAEAT